MGFGLLSFGFRFGLFRATPLLNRKILRKGVDRAQNGNAVGKRFPKAS